MGIILLPKHNFVAKTREGKYQRRRDKEKRKRPKAHGITFLQVTRTNGAVLQQQVSLEHQH
jgi:hypothetical protein